MLTILTSYYTGVILEIQYYKSELYKTEPQHYPVAISYHCSPMAATLGGQVEVRGLGACQEVVMDIFFQLGNAPH